MSNKHKKGKRYFAYTDGSVREPNSFGGSAFIILDAFKKTILYREAEFYDFATNNQMEMVATVHAIEWFEKNIKDEDSYLVVVSDSKYTVDGFNEWMENWAKNNWRTSSNKKPKNTFLWRRLFELKHDEILEGRIFFNWVKGHSGDQHNDIVDKMCREVWQKEWKKIKKEKDKEHNK